ncbi:HNH endonuclease [Stenotrophomonas phage C121]|uniref:HNH endonuclease n=1 Tax=Stenotrophomonas phage C121 TaxID=2914029 RepID=UPI0023295048|nr:HNH endonuclease [Stenotrophomonas phage C121]UKL14751.1 HNH endonuclease [Stenotrophomonas phage C121]
MGARIEYQRGERFAGTHLKYLYEIPRTNKRERRALFVCDCGKTLEANIAWVRHLNTISCGCYRVAVTTTKNTKHSQAPRGRQSGAYRSWQAMHQRVASNPDYANRPICARWCGDRGFENFFIDMGPRPKGLTIERIDNSLGYFPENCKWATYSEQNYNTSRSRRHKNGN